MGTTLVGLIAGPDAVQLFGVGDCFAAHAAGGYLRPLLRSFDEVTSTTLLDAALGGTHDMVEPKMECNEVCPANGRFFLASDGVLRFADWDFVKSLLGDATLQPCELVDRITEHVSAGKAGDNLTCAVIEVEYV